MNHIKISPSVLAADFSNLGAQIKAAADAGADYIHLDVMDGVFVPQITFGQPVVAAVRGVCDIVFDVHLMVTKPERHIESFVKAGADIITIHIEATEHPRECLAAIRAAGARAGVSVKPLTPLSTLDGLWDSIDLLLIMSVEPGAGGQKYIEQTTQKIADARAIIGARAIEIEVDGGINAQNVALCAKAGADVVVVGSAVYNKTSVRDNISALRMECKVQRA